MTSPAAKSRRCNWNAESDALRDRYGRTCLARTASWGGGWSRRVCPLCKSTGPATPRTSTRWGRAAGTCTTRLFERMQERYCPIFDRALSALLDDLQDRGLFDSTLVLAMGEFGRSPEISGSGGREHWPWGYTVFAAGGGLPRGMVLGSTTPDGGYPRTRPMHPANFDLDRARADGPRPAGTGRAGRGDHRAADLRAAVTVISARFALFSISENTNEECRKAGRISICRNSSAVLRLFCQSAKQSRV